MPAACSSALLQSPICSLGFSLAFLPPLLPRSSPSSCGLALPGGLLHSSRLPARHLATDLEKWLWVAGLEAEPLPPASQQQRTQHPLVYVREFCGLMACVHAAWESKPSQGGGHSISRESIYTGINPCGAGIHPATGEAAPCFAREKRGKLCLPCFMGWLQCSCSYRGSQAVNRLVEN